jgi:hypothetical protein
MAHSAVTQKLFGQAHNKEFTAVGIDAVYIYVFFLICRLYCHLAALS